jgi:hypothetical protein
VYDTDSGGNVSESTGGSSRQSGHRLVYVVSLLVGVLPMIGGISIYGGWALCRAPLLWIVGAFHIVFSTIVILVGLTLLVVVSLRQRWGRRALLPVIIMLLNFPLALLLVLLSTRMIPRVAVTIHNGSQETIEVVQLVIPGDSANGSALPPGGRETYYLYPDRETEGFQLNVKSERNVEKQISVPCYVSNDMRKARADLDIGEDLQLNTIRSRIE